MAENLKPFLRSAIEKPLNLPNLAWVPGENIVDYVPVSSIELSTEMSSF